MISFPTIRVIAIDDFHPVFSEKLQEAGIHLDYLPALDAASAPGSLSGYDIVAVRSKLHFDAQLMDALPSMRCIARGGAGMDNIDEAAAASRNIDLLNAPEGNRDAVAEHTIGLLLGMSKNLFNGVKEVSAFKWDREGNRGWEIGGRTVGLIGFGNTGSSVARKLSGFGCRIIAYDKYAAVDPALATAAGLEELLGTSDIISLHVPLTAETRHLINASSIAMMKSGAVLINTSRGKVCRTSDVMDGIKSGKIKSFATDVLENEDLGHLSAEERSLMHQMISSNQVFITPHVAGWSVESYRRIAEVLADKIIDYTTKVKKLRMNVD